MENSEKVSVIIPVYNAEDCLSSCLETVIGQTYENLEIILVDDGSTDGSGKLCDEWGEKDSRIQVIHKENSGVSGARNAGLEICTGGYIGFVDADDRIDPTMYEKLVDNIEGFGSDEHSDMACCGYYNYPMDTLDVKIANGIRNVGPCGPEEAVFYIYERKGYFNSVWNKIYTRGVVFKGNRPILFNEKYYVGEDEVWLAEVLMCCVKISFVPEALYHWLPHEGSAMRTINLTEKKMTVLETKKKSMEILPKDARTQSMLRAVMFNDCHPYKVIAYYEGIQKYYKTVQCTIRPMKKDWIRSDRASYMNKIKVMLLEIEMSLHFPKSIVHATSSFRRFGLKI